MMGADLQHTPLQPIPPEANGLRSVTRRGRRNACWDLPTARRLYTQQQQEIVAIASASACPAPPTDTAAMDHDVESVPIWRRSPQPERLPRRQRRNAVHSLHLPVSVLAALQQLKQSSIHPPIHAVEEK